MNSPRFDTVLSISASDVPLLEFASLYKYILLQNQKSFFFNQKYFQFSINIIKIVHTVDRLCKI